LIDWPGGVGGGLGFRFNFGPSAQCAFWLGDAPRALGFSMSMEFETTADYPASPGSGVAGTDPFWLRSGQVFTDQIQIKQ